MTSSVLVRLFGKGMKGRIQGVEFRHPTNQGLLQTLDLIFARCIDDNTENVTVKITSTTNDESENTFVRNECKDIQTAIKNT